MKLKEIREVREIRDASLLCDNAYSVEQLLNKMPNVHSWGTRDDASGNVITVSLRDSTTCQLSGYMTRRDGFKAAIKFAYNKWREGILK